MSLSAAEHIREALAAIVASEKGRLQSQWNEQDGEFSARVLMLKPLFEALALLADQVQSPEVRISISPHGHMATVRTLSKNLSISTNTTHPPNTYFTIDYGYGEPERRAAGEHVLAIVMNAVGEQVAFDEALAERIASQRRKREL